MRVHYKTFGCKTNQYDTERMRQLLETECGATESPELDSADVCVVNTCTVTNRADADARRFVRRVARRNPGARVVVAGCSAALRGAAYRAMPEATAVVEGHDPAKVLEASVGPDAAGSDAAWTDTTGADAAGSDVAGTDAGGSHLPQARAGLLQLGARLPLERTPWEGVGAAVLRRRAGATRGWLKVQDGCDRKCSFCATRLARGPSRSRTPDKVVEEARVLARTHPELVVTGVHIGHYGRDLDPQTSLTSLARRLLEEVPGPRFRLGSIEATEIDDGMIRLLAESGGRLAPHLHMPLQSGADSVLRTMRRWHTRDDYRRRAFRIAEAVSPLGLGADVITGFPGETDADHAQTRALVEELPFTYLHVFPYSVREGTVAAGLPERVPHRVSTKRSDELRALAAEKGVRHAKRRGGGRAEVVLEGSGGTALTGDYLRVKTLPPKLAKPSVLHRGRLTSDGAAVRLGRRGPAHRPSSALHTDLVS